MNHVTQGSEQNSQRWFIPSANIDAVPDPGQEHARLWVSESE